MVEPAPTGPIWTDRRRLRRLGFLAGGLVLLFALLGIEANTSAIQSRYFSHWASDLDYRMVPGRSDSICFPGNGPTDVRRGYALIPKVTESLESQGYTITAQARVSKRFLDLCEDGIYPIYHEKPRAGLLLLDAEGKQLHQAAYPERIYAAYEDIPPLVRDALLYIENRELLRSKLPYRNPAVEWDRFVRAGFDLVLGILDRDRPQPGGSTLATQLEKFRHSPGGLTSDPGEKVRQMISASYRAYLDGRDTREARRRIVLEYVNGVPLAAVPGYGEVIGLGDGLWAWYDADLDRVNGLLAEGNPTGADDRLRGEAMKEVLSLFVAQRRPSHYLLAEREALETDTDAYLRILAREGLLSPQLRDAALAARLPFRTTPAVNVRSSFINLKAANAIRIRLLGLLDLSQLYALDRIDLRVDTPLEGHVQMRVADVLQRARDRRDAAALKLVGPKLLGQGDPGGVITSFTLYETTPTENLLRVQADNWNQPLDVNEGTKLDLGSTAKLRTLVLYLEAVAEVHARYAGQPRGKIHDAARQASNPIRAWSLLYLSDAPDTTLEPMLQAALERTYTSNPHEAFFTGGGRHTFANLTKEDDGKILTVQEAFRNSVNLVFVRLMRDLVRFYVEEIPGYDPKVLDDLHHPLRKEYLRRFADKEGKDFLARYYPKYEGKGADGALALAASQVRRDRKRLAAVFRYARPHEGIDALGAFLILQVPGRPIARDEVERLYREYAPEAYDLHDRAYLTGLHPLELWLVGHLQREPGASWSQAVRASDQARQDSYKWLFTTRSWDKQDNRIRIMLENEAFQIILEKWRRLGYPFDSLVPSYATAIGSSADRPAALAELMGILVNDGIRLPTRRLGTLHFAEGTPFETVLDRQGEPGQRVLPSAVARVTRTALIDVVENGTARRVRGAFQRPDGSVIAVGGKTGTGDHRFETYNRQGLLVDSRVVNRAATFVFLIGDRFYGTITAYVPGEEAARYSFTSALAVQLLASLAPDLLPLVGDSPPATKPAPADSLGPAAGPATVGGPSGPAG